MPGKKDVSPFLQTLREICLNRKHVSLHRFADEISARTQPPPRLPERSQAKLFNNYYCSRDAKGQVKPNMVLVDGSTFLKLPEGEEKPTKPIERTPGAVTHWDI